MAKFLQKKFLPGTIALLLVCGFFVFGTNKVSAAVTVSPATGGANISADKAANASSPAWTTLGNIVITEGNNADFAVGSNVTLKLTAPSGWYFRSGHGNVSAQNGRNISVTGISVSSSVVTITFDVSNTDKADILTISNIEVQATDGAILPASGNILRTSADAGTAVIDGIANDSTNFGSLSQVAGAAKKLAIAQQPINTSYGDNISPAVTIQIQDQFGNLKNSTANVSLAIGTNPSSGVLSGGGATAAVAGTATFSSLKINKVGVGYTLVASSSGLISATSNTFNINKRPITVTADSGLWKYYGVVADPALTYSITSGGPLVGTDSLSGALDRAVGDDAGYYAIGIGSLTAGANYDLTFVPANFSISPKLLMPTITAANKIYDGTTDATVDSCTLPAADILPGDVVTCTGNNAHFSKKNVANGWEVITSDATGIVFSGADAANYVPVSTAISTTANITLRDISVSTVADSKEYDGNTTSVGVPTITVGSLGSGDSVTWTQTFDTKDVGIGKTLTPHGTVNDSNGGANYRVNYVDSLFGVITAKSITVTADAITKTYGVTPDPTLTYGVTGTVITGDVFSGALARVAGEDVNTYAISQGDLSLGGNYELTFVGNTFTISPKATLTVTASDQSKSEGATDPEFTFNYSGFQLTDDANVVDTPPTCSVEGSHSAVGTYSIACSGAADNNYDFSYNSGTLTVLDTTPPTVTNVTSPHADGSFGVGEVIPVTITFSEVVNVVGTPDLYLKIAPSGTAQVLYASGSGTDTLTFNYTVGGSAVSADLDYWATDSLGFHSGTIKDAAGNDATLTLPAPGAAGSLGANKDIAIDGVAPVSSATSDYVYGNWTNQDVTVTFGCTDDGSGCELTPNDNHYPYHCLDNTDTCTPDSATHDIVISGEGTWYLRYFSRDVVLNTENTHSVTIKIDKTIPDLSSEYLGNGTVDYQLPSLGTRGDANLFGETLVFNEELSDAGKLAVENSLTAGADKALTFHWLTNRLRASVNEETTATFANDVFVDLTDLAGNTKTHILLVDSFVEPSWSTTDWGTCSAGCGDGTQTRTFVCKDSEGTTVADDLCTAEKPTTSQSCNLQSCGGGGGGSFTPTPCASIDYDEWQTTCVNGAQFRNIKAFNPTGCAMTQAQRDAAQRTCQVAGEKTTGSGEQTTAPTQGGNQNPTSGGQVLGVKLWPNGSLLRGTDMKVWLIVKGKRFHIVNLRELWKYRGRKINDVSDTTIIQYLILPRL